MLLSGIIYSENWKLRFYVSCHLIYFFDCVITENKNKKLHDKTLKLMDSNIGI